MWSNFSGSSRCGSTNFLGSPTQTVSRVSWVISPALSSMVKVWSTLSMKASFGDTKAVFEGTVHPAMNRLERPINSTEWRIEGVMPLEQKLQVYEIHLGGVREEA